MRVRSRRWNAACLTILWSLVFTGCGGEDRPASTASQTETAQEGVAAKEDALPQEGPSSAERPLSPPEAIETRASGAFNGSDDGAAVAMAPDDAGYGQLIVPFLNRHCLKCHGPDVQEADFRVDQQLPNDFLTRSVAEKWSEVLNMLNAGDMPPEGESRPPREDVAKVAEWITREWLRGEEARKVTSIVLRRMNRVEYNNTIRDLIGVDVRPADDFPADPPAGGFDNNGAALTISPLHLEMYLKAAQDVLDRAIITDQHRPPAIKWRFQLEEGNQGLDRYRAAVGGQRIIVNGGNSLFRNGMTVLRKERQWDAFADVRDFKVPHAGEYFVRMRAAGIVPPDEAARRSGPQFHQRRQLEQERKLTGDDQRRSRESFDMWVQPYVEKHFAEDRRYRYGPPRVKLTGSLGGARRILGEFDVDAPESDPGIYEVRAWFEPVTAGIQVRNVYRIAQHNYNFWLQEHDDFPRPELLIDWMEIEGPLYDDWPPGSHRRLFIDSPHKGTNEEAYARDVLARFMRRAYRRPLREGEVDSKLALFRRVRPDRASFEEAMKTPLIAVLCSPHFLYLVEPALPVEKESQTQPRSLAANNTVHKDGENLNSSWLDDHELATRLSYFLWSSMPDDGLFTLAERGRLTNPQSLIAQADRMLADPRSEQFIKNFAGQWLGLRDVGANPPAENIFPRYDDHLEVSMRGESEAFFAEILRNDLSVLTFLRSDFVTINERLARFYDIPGVKGDYFRVVNVPPGVPRGGLVTQASILTVTSNGTRTSPVRRGVWILERLLGDPPPPPPPNAGDIPPGVPGLDKVTVRERLRLHREQSQCARCHDKIDPLGFALENFNAAGEWRDREAQGNSSQWSANDPPIDTKAQLPDGTSFVGVEGLQNELLKRQDQFLHCLAEKMYVYALGRELGYADAPAIDDAVRHMKQNQYTLRSLIHHIVSSDLFRTR